MNAEHCRQEIATLEALLRNGHIDQMGLLMALGDWYIELSLIEGES